MSVQRKIDSAYTRGVADGRRQMARQIRDELAVLREQWRGVNGIHAKGVEHGVKCMQKCVGVVDEV